MKVKELIEQLKEYDGELEIVKLVFFHDKFEGYGEFDLYNAETHSAFMTVGEIGNKDFYVKELIADGYTIPDDAVEVKVLVV